MLENSLIIIMAIVGAISIIGITRFIIKTMINTVNEK